MEPIIDYLKRRLKESGARTWPAIASEISIPLPEDEKISEHLLRKIAYGDRDNPGIKSIQPLLDYFQEVDRGVRRPPAISEQAKAA